MQHELLAIVEKTTQYILNVRSAQQTSLLEDETKENIPLLDLLDLLFKQFQLIAEAHQLTLKNYNQVLKRYNLNGRSYDLIDQVIFWGQVQAVLQLILTDYLDIQNTGDDEQRNFPEQQVNINFYFSRRKVQSKRILFRFDKSSHINHDEDVKGHSRNLSNVSSSSAKELLSSMHG